MKNVTCKKCGETGLSWHKNQKGNWVLVEPKKEIYERGTGYWIEPHKCEKIQKVKQENIEYFEKEIESIKKYFTETEGNEQVMKFMIAEIEEKIAAEKGWS